MRGVTADGKGPDTGRSSPATWHKRCDILQVEKGIQHSETSQFTRLQTPSSRSFLSGSVCQCLTGSPTSHWYINWGQGRSFERLIRSLDQVYPQLPVATRQKANRLLFKEIKSHVRKGRKEGILEFKMRGDGKTVEKWEEFIKKNRRIPANLLVRVIEPYRSSGRTRTCIPIMSV